MQPPAIAIHGLSKCYPVYAKPADRLVELFTRKRKHEEFWALRDVELELPRGATVGVIGANGSGKSTLLQIVAGVLAPTTGSATRQAAPPRPSAGILALQRARGRTAPG